VSSNKVVLDASAVLAVINKEPGWEKLPAEVLANAVVSTVNLAEVQGKLVSKNWSPNDAWKDATGIIDEAPPFTPEHARLAGTLVGETRSLGLSLGDRACLALGLAMKVPVYTADRSWKSLKLGLRIHIIR
jgi:ribonuclease VapC